MPGLFPVLFHVIQGDFPAGVAAAHASVLSLGEWRGPLNAQVSRSSCTSLPFPAPPLCSFVSGPQCTRRASARILAGEREIRAMTGLKGNLLADFRVVMSPDCKT